MILASFILGLTGSLHCAGMCGPLILMSPVAGHSRAMTAASRVVYHAGRIATYGALGALFGAVGESIAFAGFQRWLSLAAGVLMLAALAFSVPLGSRLSRPPALIKSIFSRFLGQRSLPSIFALGAANGLLPCGLVYLAATASLAAGGLALSLASMVFFGLGTLPILLVISMAGRHLRPGRIAAVRNIGFATAAIVAILLIVRAQPLALVGGRPEVAVCPGCAQ